jgi:CRISPR/Cas system-associated exonuclease Cas4 (RecB family)
MSESTFISRLANHIQIHYDLKKQELTVVFPNKRAAYYLRNAFREQSNQTIWLPQMISIEEAVTQWSGMVLADNIDLLFELIDIDAQMHVEQSSDISVFGGQAAQMTKDFDEIDQYGIDAQKVFEYVSSDKELRIWDIDGEGHTEKEREYLKFYKSLYEYYLRLRERLFQQGKGYYGMITRYLSELSETELLEKAGDGKVIFAGFNAMTATEERIINSMIKNGKAEILFDYDQYYLDDPNNEAGHFARLYQTKHTEWLSNGICDRLRTEQKTIHIISACGNALQAKALQDKLQETNDPTQAVILADEHLLIPVLNAIPDNGTYSDFKVSMGYPMAKTPVNQLAKMYFTLCRHKKIKRTTKDKTNEIVTEGWYIWPIFNLMDLEIVKIVFPKAETSAFNRWKNKAVNSGKFIFEEKDLQDLTPMPTLQEFLRIMLNGMAENDPKSELTALSNLLAFLTQTLLAKDSNPKQYFLINQLSETGKHINRLMQILERNKKYVKDLQSVEVLYRLLVSGASIKLKSESTEGLQIMGLLETRNLGFDRLHLLSVNEGILPPDKSQGSFIPHFIRKEYRLPSYAESQAVVAYHFYRLLQNGKDIYLYYNNLGDTSGGEASRFILQIKHELAKYNNIKIEEESFGNKTQSAPETKRLSAEKGDALDRLHYLIEDKGLSPSALSTYLNCPLKYYLHYIAQIKDDSVEEDVGINDIGTVIHDTLELLFADYLPHEGKLEIIDKSLFDKVILPQWQEKLKEAIASKFPKGFPDVGFNYLNHITIEQQLKNYLSYTSKQLEKGDLVVLETEGELRANLQTAQGDYVFSGRADRIDKFGGVIRVIDYKTGHVDNADLKMPVRHHSENALDYLRAIPDKALQLLLYKYMYLKMHPTTEPVEGAIHGLKYPRNIEFCLTRTPPKSSDIDADASFLQDGSFIAHMETMLEAVVNEMLDTRTPFVQAKDDKKCSYCEFRLICKRK